MCKRILGGWGRRRWPTQSWIGFTRL
jgi:hypothetical protein